MTGRPRIDVDFRALRMFHESGEVVLPDWSDEHESQKLVELFDGLIDGGTISVPDGYRISTLSDEDETGGGVIIHVERVGFGWPYASDGWSDVKNYLADYDATAVAKAAYEPLEQAVSSFIGRADRCIAFLHYVERLRDLSEDVSYGTVDDTVIETASNLSYP